MNSRTSKLLRSYSRTSGTPLKDAKREWNSTPSDKRGEVRKTMEAGLWSSELREWRKRHNLIQKDAWDFLNVPPDTLRGWESMKTTPAKWVIVLLRQRMKEFPGTKL